MNIFQERSLCSEVSKVKLLVIWQKRNEMVFFRLKAAQVFSISWRFIGI